MRLPVFVRPLMFLLLLLPCGAEAATTYINADLLPPTLLAPPPAEASPANKANIAGVLRAQKHVSKEAVAEMKAEQHLTPDLVAAMLGPDYTRENYPATHALIDRAFSDCEAVTAIDKKFWHTRRPYLVSHQVHLLIDPIDTNPSYPSGHTSGSRIVAEVLAQLFPEQQDSLRSKAASIAWHRVQAGVHYPVDIQSGDQVAMLVLGAMTASPDYQRDLAAARAEIAARPLQH